MIQRMTRMARRWPALCIAAALLLHGSAALAQADAAARERLRAMGVETSAERLVQFAAQGDVKMVELLLQAGLKATDAEPRRHVTALHNAAAQGHLALATLLIDQGAQVDAADWTGTTPLMAAAYFGQLETVRLLLARGAAADATARDGCTVLAAAAYGGKSAIVQALLARGASPGQACASGDTPLAIARRAGQGAVAALLERHAIR